MKLIHTKNTYILAISLCVTGIITPSFIYAKNPSEKVSSFKETLLNNFKCAAEIGSGIPFLKEKSYLPLYGGICLGYYFYKYNHTELGEMKSGRTIMVDTGEGKLSVEIGIRVPEQHRYGDYKGFRLIERFLTFPMAIKWTLPDFYLGNRLCTTLSLGYMPKYLISSQYKAIGSALPGSFQHDIDDLKKEFSDLRTFAHSAFGEGSFLFSFGLYTSLAISVNIKSATSSVDKDWRSLEKHTLNSEYVHHLRESSLDNLFIVGIGWDLVSLYKYINEKDY